jgi:Ca2+/Na+ antiporter
MRACATVVVLLSLNHAAQATSLPPKTCYENATCDMRLQCGKFKTSACCGGQAGCKWKPDHNGTCTGGAAPSCSGWWGGSKIVPKDDDGNDCSCDSENACLEQIDCHGWGVFVEVVLFVFSFAGLAIVCDDHLVVSLETLCVRWEVREDIAGASFMAFGSAAPEIIVNIVSTVKAASKLLKVGKDSPGYQQALNEAGADTSLGVSAILGSGIIAFSLIPGMCGLFAGQTLFLKRRPLARDVGTYSLSLLMLVLFIHDGEIERYEAALMFSVYIGYIILLSTAPKCRKQYKEQKAVSPASLYERFMDEEDDMGAPKIKRKKSFVLEVQAEMQEQADKETQQMVEDRFSEDEIFDMRRAFALFDTGDGKVARADIWRVLQVLGEEKHSAEDGEAMISCVELADEFSVEFMEFCGAMVKREETESLFDKVLETVFMPLHLAFKYTCPPCEYGGPWENWYPVTFLVAFTWVSFFSYMVGAVVTRWVALLEAPIAFFGLAFVAIGAEIPDTIQSVTVAKKGYGSMAVSNGLGSQICNINIGLGSLHCRCAQCGAYRC